MVFWCGGIKASPLSMNINKSLSLNCRFGVPVDDHLKVENTENVFAAIGDCGYSKLPPTAQVAYQEVEYLANNFNKRFADMQPFTFSNKGQICYVGAGKSVYENSSFHLKGAIVGFLNKAIYAHNAINFEQQMQFITDLFL